MIKLILTCLPEMLGVCAPEILGQTQIKEF